MSVSAFAGLDRGSVLTYLDVLLIVVLAVPLLALGVPATGYAVGGGAWILQRLLSAQAERRIAANPDYRRRIALGVVLAMARVWLLAIVIIVVGVTVSDADGLTAALVIFVAFSVSFGCSAYAHYVNKRGATS